MRNKWLTSLIVSLGLAGMGAGAGTLETEFVNPPNSARPGVYWYFMDGHLTREGMTADLEAMKAAGIGNLIFLEVNVGVPRGPVEFMSEPWQALFKHAVTEAKRLGIEITLNAGPGWTGSGGPWVKPAQSMQHLVASETGVTGPGLFEGVLPVPKPRPPYFGEGGLSDAMRQAREAYYEDVAVLAVPAVGAADRLADSDEKALYQRDPYTSAPNVKPWLPEPPAGDVKDDRQAIKRTQVIDLTGKMGPDGTLSWQAPPGKWTLLRFGRRDTGANTRPAPTPGLGFECDKFDTAALDAHFEAFVGRLLRAIDQPPSDKNGGWTMLHIDSWEMGAQNWSGAFRQEFKRRRGYDLMPFLPVWTGRIVDTPAVSERFLWDLRLTAQELVVENHAQHLKKLGQQHGLGLSIEPYDMNPTSDLVLGGVADVPMCEFWSKGYGVDSAFSCVESTSIARTVGRPIVAAEAFTADNNEAWKLYPGALKNQGDWAFGIGVNRFVFHTFAHKPSLTDKPGLTMGPYGVHWDRTQTWWPMAGAYHLYLSRCQHLLRQGKPVADVCYLIPEGAPHVFRPPVSALEGPDPFGDRRGYNFDGCTPETLGKAVVRNGLVTLPGGGAYRLLVLPDGETMRPMLLKRIEMLIEDGATVLGRPPLRSPSLTGYPQCDEEVLELGQAMWGESHTAPTLATRHYGKGRLISGATLYQKPAGKPRTSAIQEARWIWHPQGQAETAVEPGDWVFRRSVALDASRTIASAQMEITADNGFELWVNGQPAGTGNNFHTIYRFDVKELLRGGVNWLAVAAVNGDDAPNPAGLIAALRVEYSPGGTLMVTTDGQWQASRAGGLKWQTGLDGDRDWLAARVLGSFGMGPWNLSNSPAERPELYPHYDTTATLLAEMGLPPDFAADQAIRYHHRRLDKEDVYFVANKQDETINAVCRFRMTGRQPSLWDPLTGQIRPLRQFREVGKTTELVIRFEPHQSYFVVFDAGQPAGPADPGRDFPKIETVATIGGPWQVSFDPDYGGPEQAAFESLTDWSTHANPAIRHYSGRAVYRATFEPGDLLQGNPGRLALHLGRVCHLAQVKLNGKDLGVLWCAPWRVDIADHLVTGPNQLEIAVANLWPNRLIGDKALPEDQRITRTNYNPYRPADKLLPSGLLGPVTIQTVDYSVK